jgi:hypothetical protein
MNGSDTADIRLLEFYKGDGENANMFVVHLQGLGGHRLLGSLRIVSKGDKAEATRALQTTR